jgi:16S rRNA (adenine1518-N6/adenine1519-N6)-dimethyltransferase
MIPLLQERFGKERFHLIHSDVLKVQGIENTPYVVYGNIPYYITSPIIHHFLYDIIPAPEKMIITMQKEVADRILARDGKHSVLSLSCHLVAHIEKKTPKNH